MSRSIVSLSIRSLTLGSLALVAVWYALLGGGAMLSNDFPELSTIVPPPIAVISIDTVADLPGWLAAFALATALTTVVVVLRRRTRRVRLAQLVSLDEELLWAEHLAWLEERSHAHVHALVWPGRFVRAG